MSASSLAFGLLKMATKTAKWSLNNPLKTGGMALGGLAVLKAPNMIGAAAMSSPGVLGSKVGEHNRYDLNQNEQPGSSASRRNLMSSTYGLVQGLNRRRHG